MTEEAKKEEEPSTAEDNSEAMESVKDRLKFFFSDANVRQDFFIRKLLLPQEDTKEAGNVPIEALLRFNTIKQYTTDPKVVAQAAKSLCDTLVLDEKEMAIGRVVPFTNEFMDGNISLSLYLRNLPVKDADGEKAHYDVNVEEIRGLFEKYGDVALIKFKFSAFKDDEGDHDLGIIQGKKIYKKKKRYAIGHAMVEFHKKEDLQKAAGATLTNKAGEKQVPADKLVVGDAKAELDVMLLQEYIDMRKKIKEEKEKDGAAGKKHGREEDEKAEEDNKEEIPTFKSDWKPGCVIKIKGLPSACDREALLDMVAKGLEITVDQVKDRKIYVDYSRGQPDGALRFAEFADHITKTAASLKSGDLEISGAKVKDAFVLEGEEEQVYWKNFIEFKNKQIRHKEEEKQARRKRKKRKY
jgi:hypothetical protein